MILIAITTLLILAVALFCYTQGLFSTLVTFMLSVVCAAFALSTYQTLSAPLLPGNAAVAPPLMLMLLFGFSFAGLRLLFDWAIAKKNITFNHWVDRIGGVVVGIPLGMVVVGILLTVLLMLPFGSSVFGYKAYDDTFARKQTLAPFNPVDFVLGIAGRLSAGSMSGKNDFMKHHSDFELQAFAYRNRAHTATEDAQLVVNNRCPEDAARILGVFELADDHPWFTEDEGELLNVSNPLMTPEENARANSRFVIVRIAVDRQLVGKKEDTWQLPATNFRLVMPDGRSMFPVGFLTYPSGQDLRFGINREWTAWVAPEEDGGRRAIRRLIVIRPESSMVDMETATDDGPSGKALVIDWLYRLPKATQTESEGDPAKPEPIYLVFRRGLQLELPDPKMLGAELVPILNAEGDPVLDDEGQPRLREQAPPQEGALSRGRARRK